VTVTTRQLLDAKTRLERRLRDASWLRGVGIGLVDGAPGLVISVAPGGEGSARAIVTEVAPELPARVQVLEGVHKRRN
jgi:hypothetical protein